MPMVLRSRAMRPLRLGLRAAAIATAIVVALPGSAPAEDEESSEPPPGPAATAPPIFVRSDAAAAGDSDTILGDLPQEHLSPPVAAILAAHPDSDTIICLAGCGGGPRLVALRKRPSGALAAAPASSARIEPASARLPDGAAGSAAGGAVAARDEIGDVVCLAGCAGAPGEVVHRNVRLTWIDGGASDELKAALRSVADRIAAGDAAPDPLPRGWMSDRARVHLTEAPLPPVLAALVASASPLMRR